MSGRIVVAVFALFLVMVLAATAQAQTYSTVHNGATCEPYPPNSNDNAIPIVFWLYGSSDWAYCHIAIPDDYNAGDLSYVLFQARASATGPMRFRLCIYANFSFSATCGAERTIEAGTHTVNWVEPAGTLPNSTLGAYLYVRFPDGGVSAMTNFIPVFSK